MYNSSDDPDLFTKQWTITSACVLAFLAILFLILCYYIRHLCRQQQRNRRVTAAVIVISDKLRPEVLDSLPIFVYDDALMAREEKLECVICLTDFREGEKGRLLPRCCHRFHGECVDMWFETHSSCPLCRVVVAVDDDSAV